MMKICLKREKLYQFSNFTANFKIIYLFFMTDRALQINLLSRKFEQIVNAIIKHLIKNTFTDLSMYS